MADGKCKLRPHLILDMVGLLLPDPAGTAVPSVSPTIALAVRRLGVRGHRCSRVVRGGALGKYDFVLHVRGRCDL